METGPILLICSVELEGRPLLERMDDPRETSVGRRRAFPGRLAGRDVVLTLGGMGKANTAQALTAAVELLSPVSIVNFGVGGAYPFGTLQVGDVALATAEIYGDEGSASPSGWISTRDIGIPLVEGADTRYFNEFPLDPARVRTAHAALSPLGYRIGAGPFVTVSCCSGVDEIGRAMGERFEAVCESMEGAAAAHIAALYQLPFLEVRAISNVVENRDLSRWDLTDASRTAASAVEAIVGSGAADPFTTRSAPR